LNFIYLSILLIEILANFFPFFTLFDLMHF